VKDAACPISTRRGGGGARPAPATGATHLRTLSTFALRAPSPLMTKPQRFVDELCASLRRARQVQMLKQMLEEKLQAEQAWILYRKARSLAHSPPEDEVIGAVTDSIVMSGPVRQRTGYSPIKSSKLLRLSCPMYHAPLPARLRPRATALILPPPPLPLPAPRPSLPPPLSLSLSRPSVALLLS
jgi:hypothetical protein